MGPPPPPNKELDRLTDRQTLVKTLPSRTLRMRAVTISLLFSSKHNCLSDIYLFALRYLPIKKLGFVKKNRFGHKMARNVHTFVSMKNYLSTFV